MADVVEALDGNRVAVNELIAAGERAAGAWTTPRAPGKWSPSQVVEHVARSLEESANVVAGVPSKFPTFPAFVRPLVRGLFFNRVLKTGAFPKAKTNGPFDPVEGPASTAAGRTRLEGALAVFDRECRSRAATGATVASSIFGNVTVADYAKFQEYHTRHHVRQIQTG
jgi:DinB superfamily